MGEKSGNLLNAGNVLLLSLGVGLGYASFVRICQDAHLRDVWHVAQILNLFKKKNVVQAHLLV